MAWVALIGRVILGLFFIYNGLHHFGQRKAMTGYAAYKKIPAPGLAVAVSGLMLLYGGIFLVLGDWVSSAVWVLVLALLGFAFGLHNYWTVSDPAQRQGDQVNFLKNWALIGALLTLLAATPGVWHLPL